MQYDPSQIMHDYVASCFGAIYVMIMGALASKDNKAILMRRQDGIGMTILVCIVVGLLWPISIPAIMLKVKNK